MPPEVTIEQIPDRYAKVLIPDRLPAPPVEKKEEAKEAVEEKKVEEKKADPEAKKAEKKAESSEQAAARKAARAAAVARAVQSKGMLKVLGALGPRSGGGAVGYGTKSEVKVPGTVATEAAEIDSSDIDQGKLGAFVRARMGLIKACYENALKRNPTLKGKLVIRFTILETGGVSEVGASQNTLGSPDVASCIMNTMRSWRTQFRPGGPVTVEYPFLFTPSN